MAEAHPRELPEHVQQVTCDQASGHITSPQLGQALIRLAGLGYEVEQLPGSWTAQTEGKSSEKQRALQQKLDEVSAPRSGALVRTRELIAQNLGKVMDDLTNDKEAGKLNSALFNCLYRQWGRHAVRIVSGWVEEDTAKLESYQGLRDPSVLNTLINRALDADRTVSILGLDTCKEDLQVRLFEAINKSLSAQLNYLISTGAPAQNMLALLSRVNLIGQVAPILRQRVEEAIKQEAWKLAQTTYATFRAARSGSGCPVAAIKAWNFFVAALREYQVLGGTKDFTTPDDTAWSATCTGV